MPPGWRRWRWRRRRQWSRTRAVRRRSIAGLRDTTRACDGKHHPALPGTAIFWRNAWAPDWEHELAVGNVTEYSFPHMNIDDWVFGVAAVGCRRAREHGQRIRNAASLASGRRRALTLFSELPVDDRRHLLRELERVDEVLDRRLDVVRSSRRTPRRCGRARRPSRSSPMWQWAIRPLTTTSARRAKSGSRAASRAAARMGSRSARPPWLTSRIVIGWKTLTSPCSGDGTGTRSVSRLLSSAIRVSADYTRISRNVA